MSVSIESVVSALEAATGGVVDIEPDTALLESTLTIDSLTMLKIFLELEKLVAVEIPTDEAYELFGSSVKQIAERLSALASGDHPDANT